MKNIKITVLNLFSILFVFVGVVFFIKGIIIIYRIEHIGSLDNMQLDDLKEGYYVQGDVSCVLGEFDTRGRFSAEVCHNLNTMEDEYIIPMGRQYITISVPQEYKTTFEHFTDVPTGNSLILKGKIVTYKNSIPYDSLKLQFNLESEDEVNTKVSGLYNIKIVDEQVEKQVILKGLVLMISGVILFFGFDNPIRQYQKLKN